ncbi:MAG: enoyl-CoA hydratase/isomerase family protein [Janthinobacterium lividum]
MAFISVERRGHVGLVTFDRPAVLNAWNRAMRAEIVAACAELERDAAVRAVVFTGAGRAFGAGQDLTEAAVATPAAVDGWVEEWRAFFGALRGLSKPTVAALNGVAAGSAFQFALMADFRVGHAAVRMGQPEINAGVASSMGPWVIHAVLGPILAHDLALTGRMMEGEECRRHGLLTRVVAPDRVLNEALLLAEELGAKPVLAMALTRRRLAGLTEAGFAESIAVWKDNLRATIADAGG